MTQIARCGRGILPGMVMRPGDPVKHLGPPPGLMPTWARTFSTRCGLEAGEGPWAYTQDDDDVWCPGCITQAGFYVRALEAL